MYINFWYPICTSEELVQDEARRAELLGVRLVAFRDNDGAAHVLSDTCIHRGGSLSKGKVIGDCVQCPYHGWQFAGDGRCASIPSMEGKTPPARAKVDSYPVHEQYGVVFAFLGDLPEAERPPLPYVEEFDKEGWRVGAPIVFEVDAYYERSMENGLDPVHNEFVHPSQGSPRVNEDQIDIQPNDWGAKFMVDFGYTAAEARQKIVEVDESANLRAGTWYTGPNAMVTGIYLPGGYSFVQYFFEAPLSGGRTRIYFINTRNNTLDPESDGWIVETNMKIAREDQAIVENLWPVQTPDTLTRELLTPGDSVIVKYREDLTDWQQRGWRIDWDQMQASEHKAAYAIPSPARRESGNWVLEPVPLLSEGQPVAAAKSA
ncbi:MAG: aromatic ring-hydroxylating dioxygenase subunit alpha [Gammaproteobacteria bacterium]|nr:aromatic ring-hydroxylating dioxygenase subunit alpha [Gammaproteobacteria bacterium]